MDDMVEIFFPVVTAKSLRAPRAIAHAVEPLFLIETHMSFEERQKLFELAMKMADGFTAVELGSYLGASTTFIACAAFFKNGHVDAIDTWMNDAMGDEERRDTFDDFTANTYSYRHYITPIRKSTFEAVDDVANCDLLFIDGDHAYDSCKRDLELYLPKLKDGGVLAMHDFAQESVRQAFSEVVDKQRIKDDNQVHQLYSCQLVR